MFWGQISVDFMVCVRKNALTSGDTSFITNSNDLTNYIYKDNADATEEFDFRARKRRSVIGNDYDGKRQ
jgi:hypothetical protein